MAPNKWVIHTASGEFQFGGPYEPTVPDAAHSLVVVPEHQGTVDPASERWSGGAKVAKTAAEIAMFETAKLTAQRDRELAMKALQALATAVHKRIKAAVPTDTTTGAQWKAAIAAEWDAL